MAIESAVYVDAVRSNSREWINSFVPHGKGPRTEYQRKANINCTLLRTAPGTAYRREIDLPLVVSLPPAAPANVAASTEVNRRFSGLKVAWKAETKHLSSSTDIAMHWAYQRIIGMGATALPLIFGEMSKQPDHWFWALRAITGEDPVPPNDRGKVKKMTAAWLEWAASQGYRW